MLRGSGSTGWGHSRSPPLEAWCNLLSSIVAAMSRRSRHRPPIESEPSTGPVSGGPRRPVASPGGNPEGEQRLAQLVSALRDPRRYPHEVDRVEVLTTHISHVLLAGRYAYKVKRPLDLGFLDFSTLEKRRQACEEELRLNRRTAPALYLGVVSITGSDDDPHIGGAGHAIEYAVHMLQFPQSARLDHLARRGALDTPLIDCLAKSIAEFHERCPVAAADTTFGAPEQLLVPAVQNLDQLDRLTPAPPLRALRQWTLDEHRRLSAEFSRRKRFGLIRECHGDLHLGNIALLDEVPTPFDCIEFNPALRWIDPISDVAFLVMDLDDHRLTALSRRLLDRYLEWTGDYSGLAVLDFYRVYRALVRAKVAALRGQQDDLADDQRREAETQCQEYLRLAGSYTTTRTGTLVVMHGLSASGKSSVAERVAARLGGVRIRSDVERKRLHGLPPGARADHAVDRGIYSAESTQRVYARLAELATGVVAAGFSVVIDAACLRRAQRESLARVARQLGRPFVIVSCRAPLDTLRARLAARRGDASDATLEVLEHQIATEEPLLPEELARSLVHEAGLSDDDVERLLQRLDGLAGSG